MVPDNIPIKSTVPISVAITYPDDELVDLNGFAWSNTQGIIVKSNPNQSQTAVSFIQ